MRSTVTTLPIIVACVLGVVEAFGISLFGDGAHDLITFGALIIILIVKPQGHEDVPSVATVCQGIDPSVAAFIAHLTARQVDTGAGYSQRIGLVASGMRCRM